MKLTKKKEQEIIQVYNTWMNSYLNGDVETYYSYLDDDYHFIGSTDNEEFLNRKDTTQFFKDTAEQFSGKTDLRNETTTIEAFDDLIFITHLFDAWFINGADWTFYSRFRFTSVLQEKKVGWKFIYQHFSIADSKADEGETIGFDKVNAENQELREAIKRRTVELEAKNRELEIEGALGRIRAQATAMAESSELLDIVVTMRNEFTRLGHEAGYFWHMMWLPEKYEKAMTSGDGTRIGFVMELPRHIHGKIPLLAKWEKSQESTVVYAMNAEEAIDYVDKMVALGNFKNIDPQAPSHDDIRHIGGLTFVMARTTHGEIGYSLPGIVKNPPVEDLDILVQFAGAFDLAHRRFLDLQKAEQQAREVLIELALEKIRSRTMAMYRSEELADLSLELVKQVQNLGVATWFCAFNIYDEDQSGSLEWGSNGQGTFPRYRTPREGIFLRYYKAGQKGETLLINEIEENECAAHYEYLCTLPGVGEQLLKMKDNGIPFPKSQIDHVAFFKYGYILFITYEPAPESHDIFKRFAKVFEQTYTRFLDLQKAEAQAREAQIEIALERVRSRSMAMHSSEELTDAGALLYQELSKLGIQNLTTGYTLFDETVTMGWNYGVNPSDGSIRHKPVGMNHTKTKVMKAIASSWKKQEPLLVIQLNERETIKHQTFIAEESIGFPISKERLLSISPKRLVVHTFNFKQGYLLIVGGELLTFEQQEMITRFANVFQQTYTRFLDLQKAEAQAREAKIEAALERTRTQSMLMQHSDELNVTAQVFHQQLQFLGIDSEFSYLWLPDDGEKTHKFWATWSEINKRKTIYKNKAVTYPLDKTEPSIAACYVAWESEETVHVNTVQPDKVEDYFNTWSELLNGVDKFKPELFPNGLYYVDAYMKYGCFGIMIKRQLDEAEKNILSRFSKEFQRTYTRFLDLQKAEAQAREAQIETALERIRSRSMAMQKSSELLEAGELLWNEITKLGIDCFTSGYVLMDDMEDIGWNYTPNPSTGKILEQAIGIPHKQTPPMRKIVAEWKKQEPLCVIELTRKQTITHQTFVAEKGINFPFSAKELIEISPKEIVIHTFNFKQGYLLIIGSEKLAKTQIDVMLRFTKVFQQTYTRFLDLKKAEAQAREAQIENALEKVRSRSLAMHKPDELQEVITVVAEKLQELGVIFDVGGVILCTYFPDNKDVVHWIASPDLSSSQSYYVPYFDNPIFSEAWDSKIRGDAYFSKEFPVEAKNHFFEYAFEHSDYKHFPDDYKQHVLEADHHTLSAAFSKNSAIIIPSLTGVVPSESDADIMKRFAKVFEQAYIRFMDLQKAEAQAREAQIEAALERVRSRSMAMHKSEEMLSVIGVVSEQLQQLNLNFDTVSFAKNNQEGDFTFWITSRGQHKPLLMEVPTFDSPVLKGIYKAQKKGITFLADVFSAKVNKEWHEHLIKFSDLKHFPDKIKDFILNAPGFARSSFLLKNIDLYVGNYRAIPFTEEENTIFGRFAQVFDQAYTRFLDLQKAEAQAREAQIEAALEKVRSQSLAMHKSHEMQLVVDTIYEQLNVLEFELHAVGMSGAMDPKKGYEVWGGGLGLQEPLKIPYSEKTKVQRDYNKVLIKRAELFSKTYKGKTKKEYIDFLLSNNTFPPSMKKLMLESPAFSTTLATSKNSGIQILRYTDEPYTDDENTILTRFAKVFEQAYIRFMDLQKAEAQTREVQIENALEKVRSRTMAMQHSNELPEAANNLFLQVQELGIPAWSAGYCIWENEHKKTASCNMSSEGEIQNSFILPTIGEGYNFYDPLKKKEPFYVKELGGDALVKHYDFMQTLPKVGKILEELINAGLSLPTFQIFHIVYFPHGYLMFITYEPVPEAHEIFKRFAKVFEQTYTRFLDLQKAEAQAREATKQASLDRVRGQIASMRSTADLDRITPLIWNELTTMGVPFIRCGVFIIDEPTQNVEIYLSAPDGHSLGVLHLQFNADPFTADTVAHWRKGKIFKEHWNREEFISWTQSLMERGQISDKATYQGAANPPESLNLHFIPFTQGMLYVGSDNPLNIEQIQLVQSLADAFAIAYARYEDFTKLEKAKQSVEATLSELKATQNQLVQSEKMASLGELTAGIAHEIQNPLNFVNNFSEVSNELIDEMNVEIENGDLDEAKAIANDIKQNLEKINHHGKRADAIVKGMLQHSRSSSGIKEPTDINALADEYLRLAYHGLRAKDKSFNATMNTDFDDTIGKINVVPQDIGRVVLNLITNAFYAVNEKKQKDNNFKPMVAISTKKIGNQIRISVSDNGDGIPDKVKEKIFQPFFTTKPTGQGTGLGLSMSYDIITKGHGGELKVETKEGEGTEFKIQLPIT